MNSILLIDDNPIDLELMTNTLIASGYRVIAFTNSSEAVRDIPAIQPDLVVTDVLMPDQDGFETLMSIQSKYVGLPIVMVTSAPEYLHMAKQFNVDGVWAKSSNYAGLSEEVARVLRER